jgi:hypothetical protein
VCDAEGSEYAVLGGFRPGDALPKDISMELHAARGCPRGAAQSATPEVAIAIYHLADLGYAAYSQEVNAAVPTYSCDFSFRRVG